MSAASEELASVYGRCARAYDGQVPFFTTMGQRLVDPLVTGNVPRTRR